MSGFVFSQKPIELVGGEGVHLLDADGTRYLDFGASYACVPLGHADPAIASVVAEQLARLSYAHGSYPVPSRKAAIDRLASHAPPGLGNVWLCNSGAEAVEAAIKFARSATGASTLVAAMRGFHGRTMGALSVTWRPEHRAGFGPLLEDVEFVPYGDPEALEAAVDDDTAAVILEPIQGEGGVHPATASYLQVAREATEEVDAALVLDEIQTGLGRTGDRWGHEAAGIAPDVVTLAKGLANGLPIGATLVADWIAADAGRHGSTFAGTPPVAAACSTTLEQLEARDLAARATRVGDYLRDRLEAAIDDGDLAAREVRGRGLLVGVELKHDAAPVLRSLALEHNILALSAGRTVVRLLPPLTVEEGHVDELLAGLVEVGA
ncbi:MAG: aspartate aminotransferase family protein [Halobacteriota archaeon]